MKNQKKEKQLMKKNKTKTTTTTCDGYNNRPNKWQTFRNIKSNQ